MDTTPFGAEVSSMSLVQLQKLKGDLLTLASQQRSDYYFEQTLSVISYVERRIRIIIEERQIL